MAKAQGGKTRKHRKHILVIDDEPSWRQMLSIILDKRGYDVKAAESGAEALKTIARFKPDLILSDIRMPDMNGFDFFDNLKKLPRTSATPVVFFSAIDDYDAKKAARDLGAADFIVKPFDEDELGSILSRLLPR
ncbi:MAG: response regulator [Bacteroidota bacterium]